LQTTSTYFISEKKKNKKKKITQEKRQKLKSLCHYRIASNGSERHARFGELSSLILVLPVEGWRSRGDHLWKDAHQTTTQQEQARRGKRICDEER
jgi:hypothetical protein